MKYSVIIPVYNSIEYMSRVFNFIKSQHRQDVEYIFVDDCSKDDSFLRVTEICNSILADHSTQVLQTLNNCGPGGARNLGMEYANGEWIIFLDSDDMLREDFFSRMDEVVSDTDINFVLYDCEIYDSKGSLVNRKASMYGIGQGLVTVDEIIAFAVGGIRKAFKRELFQNSGVKFPLIKKAEDFAFYVLLVSKNEHIKAYYLKENLYKAYQRKNSLSRGNDDSNVMPSVFDFLYTNVPIQYQKSLMLCSIRLYLYGGLLQMALSGCKAKELKQYYLDYCKNYVGWQKHIKKLNLNFLKKVALLLIRLKWFRMFILYSKLHRLVTTR